MFFGFKMAVIPVSEQGNTRPEPCCLLDFLRYPQLVDERTRGESNEANVPIRPFPTVCPPVH